LTVIYAEGEEKDKRIEGSYMTGRDVLATEEV